MVFLHRHFHSSLLPFYSRTHICLLSVNHLCCFTAHFHVIFHKVESKWGEFHLTVNKEPAVSSKKPNSRGSREPRSDLVKLDTNKLQAHKSRCVPSAAPELWHLARVFRGEPKNIACLSKGFHPIKGLLGPTRRIFHVSSMLLLRSRAPARVSCCRPWTLMATPALSLICANRKHVLPGRWSAPLWYAWSYSCCTH